jgi:hypothetical protein
MTKKDYELIASVIKGNFKAFEELEIHPSHWQTLLVSELGNKLMDDNPKFDLAKFRRACGIDVKSIAKRLEQY